MCRYVEASQGMRKIKMLEKNVEKSDFVENLTQN